MRAKKKNVDANSDNSNNFCLDLGIIKLQNVDRKYIMPGFAETGWYQVPGHKGEQVDVIADDAPVRKSY
nr:unnamed protein product [Callosobruchus chinensis]